MTCDKSLFSSPATPYLVPINGVLHSHALGSGVVFMFGRLFRLHNLLYVPHMKNKTLLSVRCLLRDHPTIEFVFRHNSFEIRDVTPKSQAAVSSKSGLYTVPLVQGQSGTSSYPPLGFLASNTPPFRWVCNSNPKSIKLSTLIHRRIGHASFLTPHIRKALIAIYGKAIVEHLEFCDACARAKAHKIVNRKPPRRPASRPLERVHFDVSPMIPVKGMVGMLDIFF